MQQKTGQRIAYLISFAVISMAVTGYFVGLQSPMNPVITATPTSNLDHHNEHQAESHSPKHQKDSSVIPATHYSEMPLRTVDRMSSMRTSLADLKRDFDPLSEVEITAAEKQFALARRDQNRAFNGAPPTVPHPVDQMSAAACMACHGEGLKTESIRISKMSHQFLTNCTQCHVENNPSHMEGELFRESSFVGLPAPTGGPRAYPGAPPQIPHSTWMRVNCMSCHGFSGPHGIRTTHPWRQNCQQCHAPSSKLDQTLLTPEPQFLPPPEVN